jgi:DNA-binding transcriptional LysR family regulator
MAIDLTTDLIRQNLAVTLLPSRTAPRRPAPVSLPIADEPARGEYVPWSDFNPSPATHVFLDIIK